MVPKLRHLRGQWLERNRTPMSPAPNWPHYLSCCLPCKRGDHQDQLKEPAAEDKEAQKERKAN